MENISVSWSALFVAYRCSITIFLWQNCLGCLRMNHCLLPHVWDKVTHTSQKIKTLFIHLRDLNGKSQFSILNPECVQFFARPFHCMRNIRWLHIGYYAASMVPLDKVPPVVFSASVVYHSILPSPGRHCFLCYKMINNDLWFLNLQNRCSGVPWRQIATF